MSTPLANPRRTRLDHWPPRIPVSERPEERDCEDDVRQLDDEQHAKAA